MQRSSESIAALAAALAKAQIELANPEKSLIGSIETKDRNAPERLFRYASLASGLEIVRKTLGQHEIATVQTTAIDNASGIVNLTTVLAHASGEWIASDWPVCPISETATPHRKGAALTYARRYALFTLVGIAGEDDLDAPDLITPADQTQSLERRTGEGNGGLIDGRQTPVRQGAVGHNRKIKLNANKPILRPEASVELRDRLIAELNELSSADDAAMWAHRSLSEKNKLTDVDAQQLEDAFKARLATLATGEGDLTSPARSPTPKRQKAKTI